MERISAGVLALLVLGVAGCADYGTRNFGTQRGSQEQTRVTSLPPLSLPPILTEHSMTAGAAAVPDQPAPGTSQATAVSSARAHRAAAQASGGPSSSGESSLLDAAGPSVAGDIRTQVDQDAQIGRADPRYSDALLAAPTGPREPAPGPLIQRGSKSWLDSIF